MATYYKYAERSADSTINWASVGQGMTDMLKEEAGIREEKKAAIDKASRRQQKVLTEDLPSGDFVPANEFAIRFGGKAQEQLLIQDRLLKSGQLKPNSYAVLRQNLNDGTSQMFDLAKSYEAEFQDKIGRVNNIDPANRSQQIESDLMEMIEGLSNLQNVDGVINPTNGQVSLGKYIEKEIDGKTVRVLSDSANDVMTIAELKNRIKTKYNYYDVDAAMMKEVEMLGDVTTEMLSVASRGGDVNKIFGLSDKKTGNYLTEAELKVLQGKKDNKLISEVEYYEILAANSYSGAEAAIIDKTLADPFNVTSILTENLNKEFTSTLSKEDWEEAQERGDDSVIYYETGTGKLKAVPTDEQIEMARDYLKTNLRSKISVTEEAKTAGAKAFAPQPSATTLKNRKAVEKQKNLSALWMDLGKETDPTKKKQLADAVIMAANDGKGPDDDKVMEINFNEDSSITFVHSDESLNFTTSPVGDDATAWANSGAEVTGVMGQDDIKELVGNTTTIDFEGLRGMSSGRAGDPVYEETEKEAYIRYNKTEGPNASLFNTDQLVVNDESKTVTNVANMLTALGLDEKYEVDVDTSVVPFTDQIELINKETGKEVAFLQLDEYNSKSFGNFRDLILSLGADQVEDLFSETYNYRTKQKKVSSTTPQTSTPSNAKASGGNIR